MKMQGGKNAVRGFSVWERRFKDELAIHLQSHELVRFVAMGGSRASRPNEDRVCRDNVILGR